MNQSNFYIFTGGPGSGKTTLLEELQKRAYSVVPEVARGIIKEQIRNNGSALPWSDSRTYAELMFIRSLDDYVKLSTANSLLLFDRGIPDTLAYMELIRMTPWPELADAGRTYRYNKTVFIFPPWEDIYHVDQERKQSFETAVDTYRQISDTYKRLHYELVEIPQMPVTKRVDFVLGVFASLGKERK